MHPSKLQSYLMTILKTQAYWVFFRKESMSFDLSNSFLSRCVCWCCDRRGSTGSCHNIHCVCLFPRQITKFVQKVSCLYLSWIIYVKQQKAKERTYKLNFWYSYAYLKWPLTFFLFRERERERKREREREIERERGISY